MKWRSVGSADLSQEQSMDSRREINAGGGQGADRLNEEVASVAHDAREQAATAAALLKKQARRVAEQQKTTGAEQMRGVARAIDDAAGDLEKKMPQAAEFIHDMAGRLEATATSLRERSVDDLLDQASAFGRRQPAALFAGAMLTGFALTRFLKSSTRGQQS
jgi:hypothetical protein